MPRASLGCGWSGVLQSHWVWLLPITRGNIVGTFLSGGNISLRELKVI